MSLQKPINSPLFRYWNLVMPMPLSALLFFKVLRHGRCGVRTFFRKRFQFRVSVCATSRTDTSCRLHLLLPFSLSLEHIDLRHAALARQVPRVPVRRLATSLTGVITRPYYNTLPPALPGQFPEHQYSALKITRQPRLPRLLGGEGWVLGLAITLLFVYFTREF